MGKESVPCVFVLWTYRILTPVQLHGVCKSQIMFMFFLFGPLGQILFVRKFDVGEELAAAALTPLYHKCKLVILAFLFEILLPSNYSKLCSVVPFPHFVFLMHYARCNNAYNAFSPNSVSQTVARQLRAHLPPILFLRFRSPLLVAGRQI